jgi:opacity protein-like surface antigen
MQTHRIASALISLTAVAIGAAAAASDPLPQPGQVDWRGFYLGAHLGGALSLTDIDDPFGPSIYGDTVRNPGPVIGGQAGYNWQFDRTVLGLEADAAWADLFGTNTCFAYSGFYVSDNCRAQVSALGTLTGRIGWTLGPDGATLIYGKAGAAWRYGEVEAYTNHGRPGLNQRTTGFDWGWTLGAGAERALSERWSLKAEYDYLSFGDADFATTQTGFQSVPSASPTLDPVAPRATDFSQDTHLVKLGVNYRLGGGETATAPVSTPVRFPIDGTELEIGVRYVYGWGRFQKDLGIPQQGVGSLASRLTYSDMQTNDAEMFARLDTAGDVMIKGFVGKGRGGDGHLNDEDWGLPSPPFAAYVPYSNTHSDVENHIRYGVIDVGYDVWRDARVRAAPFVGYSTFHQYMQGFGCIQLANPNSDCEPSIPTSAFVISEDDTWRAVRLGAVIDIQLVPGVTLTADAAWLPRVWIDGIDDHILRSLVSSERAHGTGAQLELILAYNVTDRLSVGIGGRYWSMWTQDGAVDFGDVPGELVPMRFSVEQAALLVQGSYTFDDFAGAE